MVEGCQAAGIQRTQRLHARHQGCQDERLDQTQVVAGSRSELAVRGDVVGFAQKRQEMVFEEPPGGFVGRPPAWSIRLELAGNTAPVTHAWISEHLGLTPFGIRAAEKWFDSWSSATEPKLSHSMVLAGRKRAADELLQRLEQPPQVISIRGSSLDDILAFVAAAGRSLAESDGGVVLSRLAFVDQLDAWRRLQPLVTPLILVPIGDAITKEVSGGSCHHVIVPIVDMSVADIELPSVDSSEAAAILKGAGLDDKGADEAGRLARFSILALRRRLAVKPELHRPPWARNPVPRIVRRCLLAGRWNEAREGDRRVIGGLLGGDYPQIREELAGLKAAEDPILGSVGSSTGLVSAYDAWLLLRETLAPEDLEAFEVAVRGVLLSQDPVYDLDPRGRWRASIYGKVPEHSGDLRRGLATSLALLGALGDRVESGMGITGIDRAAYLVGEVLAAGRECR